MSNPKLLTVCIASYNRSATIKKLIQEIIDFGLNDQIEILVIDDCSPDNTFENRIQWWEELLELCNEIGQMHEYRYKSKKALANNFKMHWRKHRRKK